MNEQVTEAVTLSPDLESKVISVISTPLKDVDAEVEDNQFNLKGSVIDLSDEVTCLGDDERTETTHGELLKKIISQNESEPEQIKRRRKFFDFSGLKKKRNPKGKQYFVEEIQGKHVDADGKVSYWIKWEKYSSKSNTWEPKEHIPQFMVDEFEQEFGEKRITAFSAEAALIHTLTTLEPTQVAEGKPIINTDTSFDGKAVKTIHGFVQPLNDAPFFLVEFEDETAFVVKAEEMKRSYPLEVIRFYQSKICWQ